MKLILSLSFFFLGLQSFAEDSNLNYEIYGDQLVEFKNLPEIKKSARSLEKCEDCKRWPVDIFQANELLAAYQGIIDVYVSLAGTHVNIVNENLESDLELFYTWEGDYDLKRSEEYFCHPPINYFKDSSDRVVTRCQSKFIVE